MTVADDTLDNMLNCALRLRLPLFGRRSLDNGWQAGGGVYQNDGAREAQIHAEHLALALRLFFVHVAGEEQVLDQFGLESLAIGDGGEG